MLRFLLIILCFVPFGLLAQDDNPEVVGDLTVTQWTAVGLLSYEREQTILQLIRRHADEGSEAVSVNLAQACLMGLLRRGRSPEKIMETMGDIIPRVSETVLPQVLLNLVWFSRENSERLQKVLNKYSDDRAILLAILKVLHVFRGDDPQLLHDVYSMLKSYRKAGDLEMVIVAESTLYLLDSFMPEDERGRIRARLYEFYHNSENSVQQLLGERHLPKVLNNDLAMVLLEPFADGERDGTVAELDLVMRACRINRVDDLSEVFRYVMQMESLSLWARGRYLATTCRAPVYPDGIQSIILDWLDKSTDHQRFAVASLSVGPRVDSEFKQWFTDNADRWRHDSQMDMFVDLTFRAWRYRQELDEAGVVPYYGY